MKGAKAIRWAFAIASRALWGCGVRGVRWFMAVRGRGLSFATGRSNSRSRLARVSLPLASRGRVVTTRMRRGTTTGSNHCSRPWRTRAISSAASRAGSVGTSAATISWPRGSPTATMATATSATSGKASARCSTSARATRLPPIFRMSSRRPSRRKRPSAASSIWSAQASGVAASGARNGEVSSRPPSPSAATLTPGSGSQGRSSAGLPGAWRRQATPPVSEAP
jgi:hypothetical protein